MAFSKQTFPAVRLSDIDDLMRENVLDSSDGKTLIEYIRRKKGQARPRLNLFSDGANNPINFKLDHLQPVPAQQSSRPGAPKTTDGGAGSPAGQLIDASPSSPPGNALVHPAQNNNRIASFVTPSMNTSPARDRISHENSASTRDSRMHRLVSPSRIPLKRLSSGGNLNRQTLIKECQRSNRLKCEILRNITSSTPNRGEKTHRSDDNFMNFKETISPISEDRSTDGCPPSEPAKDGAVQSGLNVTVPSTQDQPDAAYRIVRESTPPRENAPLIIPETPSPVRRSPRQVASPFSALRLNRSPTVRMLTDLGRISLVNSKRSDRASPRSIESTPKKSILKTHRRTQPAAGEAEWSASPPNRVSFSDHLCQVHEISPAYVRSPQNSDVTSDEDSEEEPAARDDEIDEIDEAAQEAHNMSLVHSAPLGTPPRVARPSGNARRSQVTRSKPVDVPSTFSQPRSANRLSTPGGHAVQKEIGKVAGIERQKNVQADISRRSLSFVDLIRNGVFPNENVPLAESLPSSDRHTNREREQNDRPLPGVAIMPSANVSGQSAQNETNSNAIDMVMEDCGGSDTSNDSFRDDRRPAARTSLRYTINSPVAITNIDTPRNVMMEIFEPPSAFGDDVFDNVGLNQQDDGNVDPPREEENMKRHNVTPVMADAGQAVNENVILNRADGNPFRRMKSISSPSDHVSSKMVDAVDMIHIQASIAVEPTDEMDEHGKTIVLPTKRRRAKSGLDCDTESYFRAVEQVCDPRKKSAKQKGHHERRKLFVRELAESEGMYGCGEPIPSPEPLPETQEKERDNVAIRPASLPVAEESDEPQTERVPAGAQEGVSKRPTGQALYVVLKRLSLATLDNLRPRRVRNEDANRIDEEATSSAPETHIVEKQNAEASEKKGAPSREKVQNVPKTKRKKRIIESDSEEGDADSESDPEFGPSAKLATKKRGYKKLQGTELEPKHWKDVSNEIRQQVEIEGLRRSNRNRCISKQALWRNPGIDKHDAPQYKFPTVKNILRMYKKAERASRKLDKLTKKEGRKKPKETQGNSKSSPRKPHDATKDKKAKETNGVADTVLDSDGFCVPTMIPSVSTEKQTAAVPRGSDLPKKPDDAAANVIRRVAFHDSGVSSACTTNDEDTETLPTVKQRQPEQTQPSGTLPANPTPAGPVTESGTSSGDDVVSAKRQAMDWMMMLMENRHEQQEGATMMAVDLQGFTHCSIDHLSFQRRGNIEYSFYVYSRRDNFGFVRFLPNANKKMARVSNCRLKFLVVRGSLKFVINGHDVEAVGGDFLLLSTGSSYKISNGPHASLMFMIKTLIEPVKND